MAKKEKKTKPERTPTKRQLSKWQREERMRRIVIIAAVVLLVGIVSWVGYGYYKDHQSSAAAWREVVIKVNDVPFTMEYFVDTLDALTEGVNSSVISQWGDYLANMVANSIIEAELLRQGAESLNITVASADIDAKLKEYGYDERYRDMVRASLLEEKVKEYFGSNLTGTMKQAHVQVMLVESQEVATELIAEIEAGGNFTALAEQFSCNSSVEGDLGLLPEELMPNDLIANAAFNLTPGETIYTIYDASAVKEVGYWLIKVTDRRDDEVDALVMLLGSEAEAARVKDELMAGGNWSSLAEQYSQHESKTEGGKLDGLKPEDMGSTAFDQVAFNITVNEVSEPVKDTWAQTTGGYWLVKVLDRGDYPLGEEVKANLIEKRYNEWRTEWAENSTIEIYLEADKISWAVSKVLERR